MRILWAILLILMFAPNWSGEERLPLYHGTPEVSAERVPLFKDGSAGTRLGALTYLGGVRLSSRDPAFGGFSSMVVDGDRFMLLSDGGLIYRFRMGGDFVPHSIAFGALPKGPGIGWRKVDRDSESMTTDPVTGRLWVGFEHHNMIWRYTRDFGEARASARPQAMRRWPRNAGPEAMARLADGRFVVFSEEAAVKGGGTRALLFDRDPTYRRARVSRFVFVPPEGYLATDAAQLDARRLLVLVRGASLSEGFTAKLMLVDLDRIRRGVRIAGRELATLAYPAQHDNFEGLAVTHEGGRAIVWLVSDDNGPSLFQRTLLLKFAIG